MWSSRSGIAERGCYSRSQYLRVGRWRRPCVFWGTGSQRRACVGTTETVGRHSWVGWRKPVFFLETSNGWLLLTLFAGARDSQEGGVWRLFYRFPYVVVSDIRVIEQQQRALEVIQHVLFRFAVSYILEKVQVRLISTPELLVKGMDLADFTQAAVLEDGGGLVSTAIDSL